MKCYTPACGEIMIMIRHYLALALEGESAGLEIKGALAISYSAKHIFFEPDGIEIYK